MLDYLRKKIKVPEEKFYMNMLETGNTVSSTIPLALSDSLANGNIKPVNKVLLVGYSYGATEIENKKNSDSQGLNSNGPISGLFP
jgi:3-oxoacyl-[acyl-carrier-protein] synthase-3